MSSEFLSRLEQADPPRLDKRAVNLPVLVVTGKELSAADKEYLKRGMATLVRKHETSLARITEVAQQLRIPLSRRTTPAV